MLSALNVPTGNSLQFKPPFMKPAHLKKAIRKKTTIQKQLLNETDEMGVPNLPKRLFWECRYDKIDWQKAYVSVIERVLERGNEDEWLELIRYYGLEKVINTLRFEYMYLWDSTMEKVCVYFNLKPEAMKCYRVKQIRRERFGTTWF